MTTKTGNGVEIGNTEKEKIRLSMVVIKGFVLFLVFYLSLSTFGLNWIGKLSLYNHIFPGRLRLPFGENPSEAYNFSLDNLDAMFASHVISADRRLNDEYRVFVIGDSSIWGILLKPEETLSGLVGSDLTNCDGRTINVYNLGYPTLSLTKDIMVLEKAMQFKPDLIIWFVTLESFPSDKQLSSPIVANNLAYIKQITEKDDLNLRLTEPSETLMNLFEKNFLHQRRALSDLLRLQLYGGMWAATAIDQYYPEDYERAQIDLKDDPGFHGWLPPEMNKKGLAFNVLDAGEKIAGDVPLILINEPILISNGENSDIRYNFYYPRWAYDQYRMLLAQYSLDHSWRYFDFWDFVPMDEFTNSAIHLTPAGESILASHLLENIRSEVCPQ
ncbi:MAG: hypothetical protein ABIJ65_00265 [Chloroflexota bacterium]